MTKKYLTVSALNNYLTRKVDIDSQLQIIYIKGEISNLKRNINSGHLYFTLKDEKSNISAIMYKGFANQLTFDLKNGDHVLIEASVSVYAVTGYNQLIVRTIEPDGIGVLYLQFEALKKKLYQEGLFDSKYKKDIPLYPGKIAVLSAYPSAALMDVMQTIKSRFPICRVIIFPIPVQGKDAYLYIVKTLKYVDQLKFNTIILARGGGSLEHLWNFNEETLARTIFELKTPIITGVGHETDFTICDYVSDFRALTPTAAAIKATPNLLEMQDNLMQLTNLLKTNMKYKIESSKKELIRYENYYLFNNPEKIYGDSAQYLNHLQERLINEMKNRLQTSKTKQKELSLVLSSRNEIFINEYNQHIAAQVNLLKMNMEHKIKYSKTDFMSLVSKLNALSPLHTLERGYAIVSKNDKNISSVDDVSNQDKISILFKDGYVNAIVHKE